MPPGGPPMMPGAPMQQPMQPQQPMAPQAPQPQPTAAAGFATDQNITQNFLPALAIIKDPTKRKFRIDIESDSMIVIDEQQEKQSRVEFLTGSGTFLENALGALTKVPPQLAAPLVPLIMEMLLFGVRGFKAGRDMETTFETAKAQLLAAIQAMQQQAQQAAANPPPNPEVIKAQVEQQRGQQELQQGAQEHQQTMQAGQQRMAMDAAQFQQAQAQKMQAAQVDQQVAAMQPPAGSA